MNANTTILVVDDERLVTRLLQGILSTKFRVLVAHSVEEAEYLIRALDIDLIIADYYLGSRTGIELCDDIPMILISGGIFDQNDFLDQMRSCEALRIFLPKPIPIDELLLAITRVLEEDWSEDYADEDFTDDISPYI